MIQYAEFCTGIGEFKLGMEMLHKSGKWTIGLHSTDSAGERTSTCSYRCHECCIGKFQGCDSYIGREYSGSYQPRQF